MKFRIIFLKKKHIYYAVLSLIIIILLVVLLLTKKSVSTFNTLVDNNKIIQADLTGDGKKDILYIKVENGKYYMEVNDGKNNYYLETSKNLPTAGLYDANNPMKITLMDITRDKVPEIFTQSSENGKGVQHVFIYSDGIFKDMFCDSNKIIGFVDVSNNKTPKFLTGKITNKNIELSNYIFLPDQKKLENFSYNYKDNYMGKDNVYSFIKLIEGLPQSASNKLENIFYPGLTEENISVIERLAQDNNTYVFQNCVFKDIKSDNNGEISEILWTINFKGTSISDKNKIKNYTLNLLLKPSNKTEDNKAFKIYSISF
ncbi:FG-GAP repeat domain-containing protein [Clostridium prolinivorans]|uniref:FG-GAP repeat domain-containing protein n=1 Tax=Clostridium prolinivorans TaxID=2769420 RepID=UPI0013E3F6DA|nr:VCBS repeat-containing protein [Clostridium prolinivorans]